MVNKKRIEDEIKEIKFLIDNDMLDLAEEKLKKVNQFWDYNSKKIQINLLNRYLDEQK